MNYNDVRKNENKGFSLVELIVVIAIMAVMTAVLAPSLLAYVERSRAQKDDSAMGEVTNAVQLAMADQDIYDEVLYYTCYGNVSCYVDTNTEKTFDGEDIAVIADNPDTPEDESRDNGLVVIDKAATVKGTAAFKAQWHLTDDARHADEVEYYATGNMRGVTITFQPHTSSNESFFTLSEGLINAFLTGNGKASMISTKRSTHGEIDDVKYINKTPDYTNKGTFGKMASGTSKNTYLFNRVRATVGDKIFLTSQTYRNSEYTVFIRMGSTGGAQADAQDAIAVYGQWNGTNLIASVDPSST